MSSPHIIPFLRARLEPPERWTPFLKESYDAARFSNFGPLYRRLCAELERRYALDNYAVVLASNATSALTAALMGLGVNGPVVVPAFTFPATLHAVLAAGCEPVLCDVDADTWEMSASCLEAVVARRVVEAVIPVRSFGLVRDLTPLLTLADQYGLKVVADAAASFGSKERERAIGSQFGHVEVMSFHATKVFRLGEGGGVFLPRASAAAVERAMNFGLGNARGFGDGANAKVDELRCAVGLAALDTLDDVVARRRDLAARYHRAFESFPGLATTACTPGAAPWQTYPVRFSSEEAVLVVQSELKAAGIETRRYYSPSLSDGYVGLRPIDRGTPCPVSEALAHEMLCFPLFEDLTPDEETYLFEALPNALAIAHNSADRCAVGDQAPVPPSHPVSFDPSVVSRQFFQRRISVD